MTPLSDEAKLVIIQLFVDERDPSGLTIHQKRKEKRRRVVLKELHDLQHAYEKIDSDIDLEPYREAEIFLLSFNAEPPYFEFIDQLLRPYMNQTK